MKDFCEQLAGEIERQDKLNPHNVAGKLVAAKVALRAGVTPEMVCKMLKLRPDQLRKLDTDG